MTERVFAQSLEQRCIEWAAEHHGVITRRAALDLGMSDDAIDRRLSGGRWERIHPGVYTQSGAPSSWRSNLQAACLWAGDEAAASHRSAAALWSFPGSEESPIEITSQRRLRSPGVVVRQWELPRYSLTKIDNIPVTSSHRSILDISSVVTSDHLEEIVDDALSRRIASIPRLRLELQNAPTKRKGVSALRKVIAERSDGQRPPQSLFETRLLQVLKRARLPLPVRQYEIRVDGVQLARPDLCYPEYRVILEADSYRWHSSKGAWQRDASRYNALAAHGWFVVRVTWQQLHERPDEVIQTVRLALGRATIF